MIRNFRRQHGYFAVIAVVLIVVLGFIGTTLVNMYSNTANASANYVQGEQTLYIAEAGFEQAARLVYTPIVSGTNSRIACSATTGNANLTNTAFGNGTFTATASSPTYVVTALSAALTATATTISVTSTTGFAPAGRLMIDREIINYGAISGNTFTGIQRGVNMNVNNSHASGAAVSQFQCNIDVVAGIPNLTTPLYKREITQSLTMQDGAIAGFVSNGTFMLERYNRPTEATWNDLSFTNTSGVSLNGISMLSNADGWAVGNVVSSNYPFLKWNGTAWTLTTLTSSCSSTILYGVSAVNSNEAWAVGTKYATNGACTSGGKQRYTVLKYNGSAWTLLTPSTTPAIPADANANDDLYAVHVIDATQSGAGTIGFAVGNSGHILKYNGTSWTADTSPVSTALYGVYVVSASEAWAVGASGRILKWNGSTWSIFTSPTSTQLNAITMLDSDLSGTANTGYAVGNSGVIVNYNGSAWSTQSSGTTNNLHGVDTFFTANDAWAVGDAGTVLHWNGTAWSVYTTLSGYTLNAISLVQPQQFPFAWQEIYA